MSNHQLVYVGTYTDTLPHVAGQAKGIHSFRFDPDSGALSEIGATAGIRNPSYVAIHPSKHFLYAVSEVDDASPKEVGRVYAYAIDGASGSLTRLNWRLTHGKHPCHLSVDASGRMLVVANYTSGSVISFPLGEDGRLGETGSFVQHAGSSINPRRQEGPHAHMARIDASNRFVMVPDLGMDQVKVYQLVPEKGKLVANTPASVGIEAGQGPRHFDFHPNRKFAYVINELGSTVTALHYDEATGSLAAQQTISTLPDGFSDNTSCAHVEIHPSGKFLYGSNRGHDSIAIFQVDQSTGRLSAAGHESTQGRVPRNFTIDPSGRYLLAANQNTSTIVTFHINQQTGALTPTGQVTACPTPVCVRFV